jgi:mannosyl-3-phosphoglycerate phosphatase
LTPPGLIVVTDLDGTLLDEKSYSYEASLPAVEKLKSIGVPVILCSSKTHAEVVALWKELALKDPFVVENGGAIYSPARYFPFPLPGFKSRRSFKVLELGTDVGQLREVLAETADRCHVTVRSFSAMSVGEICALTGLTSDQAGLALKREYDEPFLIERGDRERLFRALIGKGLTVTRGGRFFHLTGGHEKGNAVKILLDLYRRRNSATMSVGLGDSANDLPVLLQVDRPVLIRRPDGSYDPEVVKTMPHVKQTQGMGPNGWSEAIEKILAETRY